MSEAPYFEDAAGIPGRATWVRTSDDVRLRLVRWPLEGAKATVFILTGRTEYAEKYGRIAALLAERGFAALAIDWRGQGLSDRLLADPNIGHVNKITDFQADLAAIMEASADTPKPWIMLAHSMGGCIGLRALMSAHPFKAAVFSSPMWGLEFNPLLRPIVSAVSMAASRLGLSESYALGQSGEFYVEDEKFGPNVLTTDVESWEWMRTHLRDHPELGLGGPSSNWVHEALRETRALSRMESPDLPALTWLAGDEALVDPARIRDRMARWPSGRLIVLPGQRHEVLMADPETRAARMDELEGFVSALD